MKKVLSPKITRICSFTCAILIAALVIMQFMPFWYSVNGRHMTAEDYATFDPAKETVSVKPIGPTRPKLNTKTTKATEAPTTVPETTAAPTETTGATEATTETTAATEATAAATEATAAPTEATAAPTEATAAPTEAATEAPTEAPEPTVKTVSIARVTWFPEKEKGAPVLMFHAVILLFGAVGLFFCLAKSDKPMNWVWTMALSIISVRGYLINPGAQTGMFWYVHVAIAAALALPSLVMFAQWVVRVVRWFTVKE